MIERKEIVSIEGEGSHGVPGFGLVLTGLGWLTKDTALPGIPLTRIMPIERIVESFDVHFAGVEKMEEKNKQVVTVVKQSLKFIFYFNVLILISKCAD